jgi:hypothetical protein
MKNAKLAATFQRVLYVLILTAFLICGGFVYIENSEVHKILKPTEMVYCSVLLGYFLAIIGANYYLAARGENWTDCKAEFGLVLAAWSFVVGTLAPFMFQVKVGEEESCFGLIKNSIIEPNWDFYYAFYPAVIFLLFSIWKFAKSIEN